MPFNFGPKDSDPRNSGWYCDVSMLIVPYKTDADIDWLAGRNYNLIFLVNIYFNYPYFVVHYS